MIAKNIAGQGITLLATDSSGAPYTGDEANITGAVVLVAVGGSPGSPAALATVNPTEVGPSLLPGIYWQPLAQGETNADVCIYAWKSTTPGVQIDPVEVTTVTLAAKVPATLAASDVTGSLPTSDSSGTTTLLSRIPVSAAGLEITGTVASAASASSFVVSFGANQSAGPLVGRYLCFTANLSPAKGVIQNATQVSLSSVALAFATPFSAVPQVNDTVVIV